MVERRTEPAGHGYRYLVEFERARVLGYYVIDADGRIALMQSEFAEQKRSGTVAATN